MVATLLPIWDFENLTGKVHWKGLKSSDIIQSACVTAIHPELPCLVDKLIQVFSRRPLYHLLSIIDYMLGIFRHCRLSEIREFLKKKRTIPLTEMSKKDQKVFYLILMKQKPNFPAGFSAKNATSKNIPNCNLNEYFAS